MPIRRERRRRRAALAVWAATVCTTVVAALAVATPSASAYVPCPDPIPSAGILNWNYNWPTFGADPKGVTMCHGFGSALSKGYLQIVDLDDGAKIRLVSQVDVNSPTPGYLEPYTTYEKRTAEDWYSYIKTGAVSTPSSSRLFSTTNASFFNDSDNGVPTTLPFPHRYNLNHETWGTTIWDQWLVDSGIGCPNGPGVPESPDYCAVKKVLHVGYAGDDSTTQRVNIATPAAPMIYDAYQARLMLEDRDPSTSVPRAWDATMAFQPDYSFGGSNRRNYVGMYGNKVYIFTSDADYTNAEAYDIMQAIQPGMNVIQMDGGGSAQLYSDYGEMDSSIPILNREVPDVLAVYFSE